MRPRRSSPTAIQAATYIAGCRRGRRRGDAARRPPEHMEMLLDASPTWASTSRPCGDGLRVRARDRMRSIDVATLPYPGIATDYKPLIITMLSVADGVGIVTENLYPGRFRYVEELQRLGADIRTDGHHAVVRGVPRLSRRAGAGARHPRRRGDGRGRAGRRGRDGDHAACTTSTAATTTSSGAWRPSAPTSNAFPASERVAPALHALRTSGGSTAGRLDPPLDHRQEADDHERSGRRRAASRPSRPGGRGCARAGHVRDGMRDHERNESYRARWLNDLGHACQVEAPSKSSARPCRPTAATSCCATSTRRPASSRSTLVGACGTCPASHADTQGRHRAHHARPGRRRHRSGQHRRERARRGRRPVVSRRPTPPSCSRLRSPVIGRALARLLSLIERGGDDARRDRPPGLSPQRRGLHRRAHRRARGRARAR